MAESEKDRIARQVADLRVAFDLALSDKRKYPVREFDAFLRSARHYIEITAGGSTIHKSVAWAVNGLLEFPQAEKKRIPGNVLFEADPELPPGRLVYPWRLPIPDPQVLMITSELLNLTLGDHNCSEATLHIRRTSSLSLACYPSTSGEQRMEDTEKQRRANALGFIRGRFSQRHIPIPATNGRRPFGLR